LKTSDCIIAITAISNKEPNFMLIDTFCLM
jgi:hypothetical protein